MTVHIITPETTLFSGSAKSVILPGITGSLGILDRHAPLITALKRGKVEVVDEKGASRSFEINGGTVEVSDNVVSVLAD